jgi:hypothetical protein
MLRALAEAARALGRADYRAAAESNAGFLLERLTTDGRLRRTWRAGRAKGDAFLEDGAAVAGGLISTYEATGTPRWLAAARTLVDDLVERFWDEEVGGFFDTARDHERLIGRPRELTDNATPSGTSLAVEALLRLAALTGELDYRERAARVLVPLAPAMAERPSSFGHLLAALDDLIGPLREIAVVGVLGDAATRALLEVINARYLPRSVLAVSAPGSDASRTVQLLADRPLVDGRPAAYICQDFVCQAPITEPMELAARLE